jgi:hypothetical protein
MVDQREKPGFLGDFAGCPGIMEMARGEACGCPGTEKFGPKIRITLLAKKVTKGVKKG